MCVAGSSMFPLNETIKICSDALYHDYDLQPLIPKYVFVELMKSATPSVEFSFNNTTCKQTDGVAMGSPLGPALANIFVGYYEEKMLAKAGPSGDNDVIAHRAMLSHIVSTHISRGV